MQKILFKYNFWGKKSEEKSFEAKKSEAKNPMQKILHQKINDNNLFYVLFQTLILYYIPTENYWNKECISLFISIHDICQRRKLKNEVTYLAFLDLKKAYDSPSDHRFVICYKCPVLHIFSHSVYNCASPGTSCDRNPGSAFMFFIL